MLIIEFETKNTVDDDFPNNRADAKPGAKWYVRNQPSLLFKSASKYPDKFLLNLSFSSSENEQKSIGGFTEGRYFLDDEAFFLDPRDRNNPACNFSKLVPVTNASIDSRIQELKDLKLSLGSKVI